MPSNKELLKLNRGLKKEVKEYVARILEISEEKENAIKIIIKLKKICSHSLELNERDVETVLAYENILRSILPGVSREKNESYYEDTHKTLKLIGENY